MPVVITLMRVEAAKLRTTPTLLITAGFTIALSAVGAVTNTLRNGQTPLGSRTMVAKVFTQPVAIAATAMLVFGILSITGEYKQRTIQAAFLAEPRRARVVFSKLITAAAVGAVVAAASFGVVTAVEIPLFASKGVRRLPIDFGTYFFGAVLAGLCFAMLGVALGAVTRNGVAAIVVGIVWTQLVENTLLQDAAPQVAKWLPTEAAVALTPGSGPADLLTPPAAAVVLVAWAVVLTGLAVAFVLGREAR